MTTSQKVVAFDSAPGLSRYAALAAALRARVVAGEWPPGSALPAESLLATEHQVALGTMRRALELLVAQGLVERIHGRGTFVRQGIAGASMLRFFRFDSGSGEMPRSRILSRQRVAAPAAVARRLGLATGEMGLRLERLRLLGGRPRLGAGGGRGGEDCVFRIPPGPAGGGRPRPPWPAGWAWPRARWCCGCSVCACWPTSPVCWKSCGCRWMCLLPWPKAAPPNEIGR